LHSPPAVWQALYLLPAAAPAVFTNTGLRFSHSPVFYSIEGDYMLEGLFQPMHLLVIFGIALLVFGPKKLPELGKGIGEGIRGFKSAMKAEDEKPVTTTAVANERGLTQE
jgi:sec-independent protein translocase protein TatA